MHNGEKAYMHLCDDTERDYGNLDTAEKFAEKCKKLGFETVSMKNEFSTIYGDGVIKTDYLQKTTEEEQKEAPDQKTDQETPDQKADQAKDQETPDQKADQTKDQKTPDQKTDQTKDQAEGQKIQDQKTDQTQDADKETDNRTEQQIIEEQENSDEQMPGMDDPLKLKDGQEPEEEEILKPAA